MYHEFLYILMQTTGPKQTLNRSDSSFWVACECFLNFSPHAMLGKMNCLITDEDSSSMSAKESQIDSIVWWAHFKLSKIWNRSRENFHLRSSLSRMRLMWGFQYLPSTRKKKKKKAPPIYKNYQENTCTTCIRGEETFRDRIMYRGKNMIPNSYP